MIKFYIIVYLRYFILSLLTEIYFYANASNKQLYPSSNKFSSKTKIPDRNLSGI